jgi:PAS domain S-box-containing protein
MLQLDRLRDIGSRRNRRAVISGVDIYGHLFESFDPIFWEADPQTLQLRSVSPKAAALLGYPQSAWTSNSTFWADIVHPDDRQRAMNTRLQAIRQCQDHRIEYRVIAMDGALHWVRDSAVVACEGGQPTRVYGVMIDITPSPEQQQHEGRYRALVEHSADAIALLDRDGTIQFISESAGRISDFEADYPIGSHFLHSVHPEDVPRVRQALEKCALRPGNRVSAEYRVRHVESAWRHHEIIGINRLDVPALGAIVVNCRDVTDRGQPDEALIESQRALASTFDEAPIGIAHTSLDGRWLRVNRRFCELLGYTAAELMATSFIAITHPDDAEQDYQALTQVRAGTIRRYEREKRYRHKDGHYVSVKLTAVLHRDSAGQPKYFIATIEDVTDRVRLEGQLRQGQKMEAVGRLAGGVAHEFNNLLTVIVGYAQLVLLQLKPGVPMHSDVEAIRHAGQSAAALTRQLLALGRKQMLQPQVLDLNEIVSRMNALLRRLINEDVELVTQLATPLDRVWADPGQMEQIILNLAINARDAMPHGGTLTIETMNAIVDTQQFAQLSGSSEGRHVLLAITDTGVGMDQDVQAHLFEPFFTTKERGEGTGLGLATVHGIVKQSGGSIGIHSEPEHGTRVEIFLPGTKRRADRSNVSRPSSKSLAGTETILLVEDQPEVRAVTREILSRHGYNVLGAANGAEAILMLESHDGDMHLMMTDAVMPGMSGRALAEQLVVNRPQLCILYTSGYTDDTIVYQGIQGVRTAFVQKPYTPDQLLQKIRGLLDSR